MSYVPPYAAGMRLGAAVMLPEDIDYFFRSVAEGRMDSVQRSVETFKWLANHRDGKTGATPVIVAAQAGNLDMVKYLQGQGADLNATDNGDQGAIFYAGHHGWPDVAQYLIDQGVDPTAPNGSGVSAAAAARANDHLSFADRLVEMRTAYLERQREQERQRIAAENARLENVREVQQVMRAGVHKQVPAPKTARFRPKM